MVVYTTEVYGILIMGSHVLWSRSFGQRILRLWPTDRRGIVIRVFDFSIHDITGCCVYTKELT